MQSIPFNKELTFEYGTPAVIAPLVRRVVARNPSMFTLHGTGTYIIGRGKVAIIDPGPDLSEHVTALLQAGQNETVTDILITHTHIDHSPLAAALTARTALILVGRALGEVAHAASRLYDPAHHHVLRPKDGA